MKGIHHARPVAVYSYGVNAWLVIRPGDSFSLPHTGDPRAELRGSTSDAKRSDFTPQLGPYNGACGSEIDCPAAIPCEAGWGMDMDAALAFLLNPFSSTRTVGFARPMSSGVL
jgi:hypothetical protein